MSAAAVQGGGARGFRKSQIDPSDVLAAQLSATRLMQRLDRGTAPQLVLWPEDVVSLDTLLSDSPEEGALSHLARGLHATLVVGVTETVSSTAFRNEVVACGPDGTLVSRYEKVHRVPFGEYVPYRGFFAHLANLSAVPLDAVPGTGTGLLPTPAAPLGAMVSYEVFYADRGRSAVRAGAQLLIVPTNTSSYATSQVPTQEIAASEVQAVQQGRDLLQAAPDRLQRGHHQPGRAARAVEARRPQMVFATLSRRVGCTVYVRFGDLPVLVLSGVAWLAVAGLRRPAAPAPRRLERAVRSRSVVVAGVDVDAGDALGMEHGEVVGVVLEGQSEVESVDPKFVHAVPLEPGHLGVVAPGPHDQEVPTQAVPFQPGQRLGLHPHGPAGEQDHLQPRIEQLEHTGQLADDRVVAAGVEERLPVAPPSLDEVLAAHGVGEHSVDVEHHSRARAAPAVRPAMPSSTGWAAGSLVGRGGRRLAHRAQGRRNSRRCEKQSSTPASAGASGGVPASANCRLVPGPAWLPLPPELVVNTPPPRRASAYRWRTSTMEGP